MVAVTVDFESSPAGENSRNLCYSGIEAYDEPGYRLLDEAWLHLCTGWFRAAALRIVVETRSPLLIASRALRVVEKQAHEKTASRSTIPASFGQRWTVLAVLGDAAWCTARWV